MNFGFSRRQNHPGKPKVLPGRDIPSLAEYIKSKNCKNIMVMLGAGAFTWVIFPSTCAAISYSHTTKSNLARLNLPHPEAVFEINFFRKNPVPFYTLAHELYPGKFRPTITHSFIRLLAEKSLLHTCFTQNIDTLERRAGVPEEKVVEAHGSFATQRCIVCRRPFDDEKMKEHIDQKKIAKCEVCGGYVKPDIVFFGENLPPNFIHSISNLRKADLLIVMGTSLTVHPFASLAGMVDDSCPRVLINLDRVGDFGSRADDVILLGKCDDIVKDLCKELGWEEELIRLWNETADSVITAPQESTEKAGQPPEKPDELVELEKELAELTLDTNESVAPNVRPETRNDKTLVVEKIPEDKLSLESINSWFKRFGTVTNVAIDTNNAKALVSFSNHDEAHAACKSEDAVFGNRFVKVFWHRPMEGHGQVGARMLAPSAPLVANTAASSASAEQAGMATKDSEDKASASVHPASLSDSPPAATTDDAPKGEPEATPLKSEDAVPAKQQELETPPADNKKRKDRNECLLHILLDYPALSWQRKESPQKHVLESSSTFVNYVNRKRLSKSFPSRDNILSIHPEVELANGRLRMDRWKG
ncbi:DHS-like NAD/FAD-binding domain-containing protein [Flammula alnicola]|nr:DHS-like NAD/FAD-binding domain-containing protein [Flammula alnicola]